MSINTELKLLKNTKENLRTAIMEKGVVVSSSDLFSTYPTRISQISTQSGTYDESLKKLLDGSYTSYEIPNGTEKLKTDAFRSYTSLASITIPPTIKTVGSYAFKDCTSLNRVNITDLSAWCGIDFKTAESGSDVSSNPLKTAHRLYMNGTQIKDLVIPNDVTEIKPYVFYSASGFTSVVIPDSVTTIGSDAFKSCSGLKTVEIGTGITSIDTRAFYYCSGLTSITVKAETPPTIGSVVFDDTNNAQIFVPEDSVQAYKTAWSKYASRIQAIPVESFAMKFTPKSGGTPIEVELEDLATAGVIEKTDVPSTIKNGTGTLEIGEGVTTIERLAFQNCSKLTSVTISDSVTSIEAGAFWDCSSLTSANIPDSVTFIGTSTFQGCTSLTSVTIPNSVTGIGDMALYGCTGLNYITVSSTTPPTLAYDVFGNTNDCPLIVPVSSVDTYKTAWSAYADRIVGEGVAYWKLIYSECDTDGRGKNTGYVINMYEDVNPTSPTYGNTRTDYVQDEETCPIPVAVPEFRRIQYIQDVTSGKYLIVDTANNIALNASLIAETSTTNNGINANKNYISVDIDTAYDTIEATETTLNAAVDYYGNYLTWTDENSGTVYYLTPNSSSSPAFKANATSPSQIAPFYSDNGCFTFKSEYNRAIAFFRNSSGSNYKFRWQPTNIDSNFDNVALFKLVE